MNSQQGSVNQCVVCGWDGKSVFGKLPEIQGAERLCKKRFWFGPDLCSVCAAACRGLSLWQPWAGFIAAGEKTIETRTWATDYRGPVLICAAKKYDDAWRKISSRPNAAVADEGVCRLLGVALCVATLADCRPHTRADEDASMVRFYGRNWPALHAWVLADLRPVTPFDVRGRQGLFAVNESILRKS